MSTDIRRMGASDVHEVLRLMRALAAFEGYLNEFAVTAADLAERAFAEDPDFTVWVCGEESGRLAGYAVTYWVWWTYTLKPSLVLKELYVIDDMRGRKVGGALFDAVRQQAATGGAGRIDWLVLPENIAAKAFYRAQGARPDPSWERWVLHVTA